MKNFKITPDICLTVGEIADPSTGEDPSGDLTALLTVWSGKDHDLTIEDLERLVEAGQKALQILALRKKS